MDEHTHTIMLKRKRVETEDFFYIHNIFRKGNRNSYVVFDASFDHAIFGAGLALDAHDKLSQRSCFFAYLCFC